MKKNNKGFTLVELIVVLVILAILAAILTPALLGYIDRARSEKDYSTAQTVRVAAQAAIDQAYGDGYLANGVYDTTATKVTKISEMNNTAGWTGEVKLTNGAPSYTNGELDMKTGGKYERMVFTLSSVDPSAVNKFKFYYSNGIITHGYVVINSHYYKLNSNGTWEASENEPTFS